jgi:HK97 family phage portal protein
MTAVLGPNGLPLKSTMPAAVDNASGWFVQSLNQDSNRWSDATDDAHYGCLRSYEEIYGSQPAVFTAVNKIARRIATLPFEGFVQVDRNKRDYLPPTDALASLIRRPWPRASTVHLLTHIAQGLLLHGNALVVKVRLAGPDAPPDMLWPLSWSKLSAWAAEGSPIVGWSTTQFGGVQRWIDPEDVIHFAWLPPDASGIGISPLEALGVTIRLEDATQRYQTAQFRNGNRPSLAVSLQMDNPSQPLLEYARERVEAMHKGADNAGKTFFTGANTTLTPLSMTPVEAALIEQRQLNREEVGMVYDLAGPLMNDLSHATLANVEQYQSAMYRDVVPPWTTLAVETFQAQLLDPEPAWIDRIVRFDFTDKLRGDPQELSVAMRSDVEGGLRTRNEARRIMGEMPYGDPEDDQNPANKLFVNANNQAPIGDTRPDPQPQTPGLPPVAPPVADKAT